MRGIAKSLPANCNLRRLLADYSIEQKLYRQQSTLGFQPAPSEAECLALAGCWKSTLDAHFGPEAFASESSVGRNDRNCLVGSFVISPVEVPHVARADRGQGLYSLGALIATYVEVSDEADQLRAYSVGQNVAPAKFAGQLGRTQARAGDVANQNVSLDLGRVDLDGGTCAKPWARNLALAWSSVSFRGPCSKAMSPAAARIPAWRIPPPRALR